MLFRLPIIANLRTSYLALRVDDRHCMVSTEQALHSLAEFASRLDQEYIDQQPLFVLLWNWSHSSKVPAVQTAYLCSNYRDLGSNRVPVTILWLANNGPDV